jgi:hypothetical protein
VPSEEQVGWVEGRAVALLGFETADEAQRAAVSGLDRGARRLAV